MTRSSRHRTKRRATLSAARLTLIPLAIVALLSACAATDPLLNPNDWRPNGANEANIAAQVANPADLKRGRGASGTDGEQAAVAVQRLRAGKVKALPDSGISELHVQSAPASAGAP
jgi:type IV pilus biogenesis protein CpaD/CtpE